MAVKLHIAMSNSSYKRLMILVEETQVSAPESVISAALKLYESMVNELAAGNVFQMVTPQGEVIDAEFDINIKPEIKEEKPQKNKHGFRVIAGTDIDKNPKE